MNTSILIAYATMSGSTREIAEAIQKELAEMQIHVDVRPCREVKSLDDCSAVVIGAPIYMFHLHKDATRFIQRHQKRLTGLPVAVFAGGPYGPNAAEDGASVRQNLQSELAKFAWLKPVSVQMVGGRFDSALLRFPYNLIPALKQAPADDARNWDEIRNWAGSLPALMNSRMNQPTVS